MKIIPSGRVTSAKGYALRAWILCATALTPILAHSQINALDGEWTGGLACGELQTPSARSTKAFTAGVTLNTSMGSMRGTRQNNEILETYSGSIDRTGRVTLDASGHWKGDPSRAWRIRLHGNQSGSRMVLRGPMESPDGKTQLRACHMELSNLAVEQRARANSKPSPVVPKTSVRPTHPAEPAREPPPPAGQKQQGEQAQAAKALEQKAIENAAEERAITAKRQADDATAATARTQALEIENARLLAEKAAAERAAAEKAATEKRAADAKKVPIKARSTMDL